MEQVCHMQTQENSRLRLELMRKNDVTGLTLKKLREKNCDEVTATLELMGSFDYMAGNCVQLKGFHAFDGKYIITKAGHSIGSGYTVSLEIRRCLDGY